MFLYDSNISSFFITQLLNKKQIELVNQKLP